ncbi:MAG: hypothetical protein AB7U31_06935 [Synergistaceae bacterium]
MKDGKVKIRPEEAERYAKYVLEHVFKGQSIAATLIAFGTYVLLDFVKQPDRMDLFSLGIATVLAGYVYNYLRAKKKIRAQIGK